MGAAMRPAAVSTPLPTGYTEDTPVYRLLTKLVLATPLNELPSEQELRDLAAWTEDNQAALDSLAQQLSADPDTLMRLRREARQALESLKDEAVSVESKLGDTAIEALSLKQQDAVIKSNAGEASAKDLFKVGVVSSNLIARSSFRR